ncbi:hypothetical protein MASR1M60_31240 [Rhodocyclaceae bacterium]
MPDLTLTEEVVDVACLPNGDWIVADRQRFWLHHPQPLSMPPFVEHLSEPGDRQRTRQLFAGVLAAAMREARSTAPATASAGASLQGYIYQLAASYQNMHTTPPTLRRVAERFRAATRKDLADYCEAFAREESGHDELVLRDLAALGIDAQTFVEQVQPASALALVDYFHQLAEGDEPVGVLGYAYALERMALFQTRERVAAIEALIPVGIKATRCLRVHSAVGVEVRHVDDSLAFIAQLSAAERLSIVRSLYRTATLMNGPSDYPGDAAVDALIKRLSRPPTQLPLPA